MYKLDILYAINAQYLDFMLASLLSLSLNSGIVKINVHIVIDNCEDSDIYRLENFLRKLDNVTPFIYDMKDHDIQKYGIPNWRGSQIPNARLFFQDILKQNLQNIDNLLYLDADTIIISNLGELKKYENETICASKDFCQRNYSIRSGLDYYNSGVLFINVKKWCEEKYMDNIIEFISHNKVPLILPDQDVLNYSIGEYISPLPVEYNLSPYAFTHKGLLGAVFFNKRLSYYNYSEIKEARENAKILHALDFYGTKPWQNNSFNPYTEEFLKYIREVNPDFSLLDSINSPLDLFKHPEIYYWICTLRLYLPNQVNDKISIVAKKIKKELIKK